LAMPADYLPFKGTDGHGSLASWPVVLQLPGFWSSTTTQKIAT
jgi:hypothetical protein